MMLSEVKSIFYALEHCLDIDVECYLSIAAPETAHPALYSFKRERTGGGY